MEGGIADGNISPEHVQVDSRKEDVINFTLAMVDWKNYRQSGLLKVRHLPNWSSKFVQNFPARYSVHCSVQYEGDRGENTKNAVQSLSALFPCYLHST